MSICYNIYIGPYIRCHKTDTHPNPKIMEALDVDVLVLINTVNNIDRFDNNDDVDWFIGNSRKAPGCHINPKYDFGLVVAADEIDIASDKDMMEQFYQKELAVLRVAYGTENVSMEWGVISYIS